MIQHALLPDGPTCFLLEGALDSLECQALRQRAETLGFEPMAEKYPKDYRCNDRLVLDDPALAGWLWRRVEPHLPELSGVRPVGLNPRWRFCRYRDGQSFCLHRDGAWSPSPSTRTRLTLQLYLNDGSEFEGGETTFTDGALRVKPKCGMAIVFDHRLWHAGQAVTRGTKYVLRSDVVYPLPTATPPGGVFAGLTQTARYEGHLGYVWQAVPLRDGRVASGSRDGTLRLWPSGEVIARETSSIVALTEKLDGSIVHGTREQGVLCLATLPDGSVAAGMSDGTLRLGERSLKLCTSWLWSVVSTRPGRVSVGTQSGELVEVDTEALRVTAREQLPAPVRALAQLRDQTLLAGLGDGQLWHAGRLRAAHASAVTGLCEVRPGVWATSSEDCSVGVWDSTTGARIGTARHDDFVRSIAVIEGELLSASYDCSVRRWAISA